MLRVRVRVRARRKFHSFSVFKYDLVRNANRLAEIRTEISIIGYELQASLKV